MDEDIIKGSFTRYVETALKRSKRDYIKKQQRKERVEEPVDMERLYSEDETGEETGTDFLWVPEEMPWEADVIRHSMKICLGESLWIAFSCLTDFEVVVVFAKVYRRLTFAEIGIEMGERTEKVADSYSYARKKMKKGWKKNENGRIVVSGENGG